MTRSIECEGEMIFSNGKKVLAKIQTLTNRPNKWFKARGTIYFDVDNLPLENNHKWQVGIFYCRKYNHNKVKHVFSLTASDSGKIDRVDGDELDKIILDVAVTRIDEEIVIDRPRVKRIED